MAQGNRFFLLPGAPADEIDKAEAEFRATLSQVTALIERLRAKRNVRSN